VNDLKNSTPRGVNDYEKISSGGVKGSENRQNHFPVRWEKKIESGIAPPQLPG
jgi:hypothetical protein